MKQDQLTDEVRTGMGLSPNEAIEKLTDQWASPPEFYQAINLWGSPNLDVCATQHNTKCRHFISPLWDAGHHENRIGYDAFSTEWVLPDGRHTIAYCNPPYSRILPWVDRAIEQAIKHGTETYMVVLAAHTPAWFDLAYEHGQAVYLLHPRIPFLDPLPSERQCPRGDNQMIHITKTSAKLKGVAPIRRFNWKAMLKKLTENKE